MSLTVYSIRVIEFSKLFQRLVKLDIRSAQQELAAWPLNDLSIFDRLRIWVAGMPELVSETEFTTTLLELDDAMFWDRYSQKDLLPVLSQRWQQLTDESRVKLESRLLAGPQRWNNESESDFHRRNAWLRLNSLHWLADQCCCFSFDLEAETQRQQLIVPEWKKVHSRKASKSIKDIASFVSTNEDYSQIAKENLANILSKSLELSDHSDDFLIENDPFAGLCKEKPILAFRALSLTAKNSEFPEWAWEKFLYSTQREQDRPKFSALIAERINSYPAEQLLSIITPICSWLKKIGNTITSNHYSSYLRIVEKLIMSIEIQPSIGSSSIIRSNKPVDWVFEAINSSVGDLVEILILDPNVNNLQQGMSLPISWLSKIQRLLRLPNNLHRYVLVVLTSRLQWFYYWNQSWTEINLLTALEATDDQERQAFWSGFLRANGVPSYTLYMRLKPHLLAAAKDEILTVTRREQQLIAILLVGWGSASEQNGELCITDRELHDLILDWDDDNRCQVLSLIRQMSKNNEKWSQLVPALIKNWPLHKAARTSRVSASLFELAFSSIEIFKQTVTLILPLLTPVKRPYLRLSSIEHILDAYPEQCLAILNNAFSENLPNDVPYGLGQVLDRIADANNKIQADERWLHLKRKLDNR
ncbi:MAG: hypothetical protein IPN42_05585 [Methylococcaceae bacterium]|nr:hypothetical protein [Methylococcaceae bacterium]